MERGNGLISEHDLRQYKPVYREPVIGSFKDIEIISMGPPSSGGLLLIHMLNALENFQIDTLGWNSTDYIHLLTEVAKRAYADRAQHLGDPDFWNNPRDLFLSKAYAKNRIAKISMKKHTPSNEVYPGTYRDDESDETTHYSVVDSQGNAVAITSTLNQNFGNKHVVAGAGFFLNNEMDDFSVKPGTPNYWGLVGDKANAIEPNKRPLSSMTPTILMYEGIPIMTIGSPGGSRIIGFVSKVLVAVIDWNLSIQEAINLPNFLSRNKGTELEKDSSVEALRPELEARGHIVNTFTATSGLHGIHRTNRGLEGGVDPRREGVVLWD